MKKYVNPFDPHASNAVAGDGSESFSNGSTGLHATNGRTTLAPLTQRKPVKISTVSHTLDAEVAERLRHFAFHERISESAVIEFALRHLFGHDADDRELGQRLRKAGAALRRRT